MKISCTLPLLNLIALDGGEIKYSTVQNWYPGDKEGKGGIYNFVTKRGICGANAKISWTQVETGSAITWKYPSVILKGDNSTGEFYSVAVTNNYQQADTGTKMMHVGKNTRSRIVSKGISAGKSQNSYRGLVQVGKNAHNSAISLNAILCYWAINAAHILFLTSKQKTALPLLSTKQQPARLVKTRFSIAINVALIQKLPLH